MSLRDPIIIPKTPALGNIIRPFAITPEESDQAISKSQLGTPVYSNIIFNADPNTPENADIVIDTVLLEVYQPRNIIKTQVAGRAGTIKEYISEGDFDIICRGAVVSQERNVFPIDEITALKNIFSVRKEITVSSNFLSVFEIETVVVEEYSFGEREGHRNHVPFFVRMSSDRPIQIKLNA